MAERGAEIRKHWDRIPNDTDILVTHGPPHGILDRNEENACCGCQDLLDAVLRIRPKLHVFGHIHPGNGTYRYQDEHGETIFVNAAMVNDHLEVVNEPIVIDLE